jgi:glycosyltransferase involved in cell wall biosynthesis
MNKPPPETKSPFVSIVLPVFNEQENLQELHQELTHTLSSLGKAAEIIFVDDGSTDESLSILKQISATDPRVRVFSFTRNFGQTAALACGFDHARGQIVLAMDADGQNDPADVPRLVEKLQQGYDVVSGWRKKRKDKLIRRLLSFLANKLISAFTGVKLHDYGCTLKAYRKEVLQDVELIGEMHRFLPAIASWRGARVGEMVVNHRPRRAGKSKYGMERVFKVLLDLVTVKFMGSYRTKPIYFFGSLGILSLCTALILLAYLIYDKLTRKASMIQSPLLLLSAILVIISVQFVLMGLLAELSVRIYHSAGKKPTYFIKWSSHSPEEQ